MVKEELIRAAKETPPRRQRAREQRQFQRRQTEPPPCGSGWLPVLRVQCQNLSVAMLRQLS
jgi:hypothetical protein